MNEITIKSELNDLHAGKDDDYEGQSITDVLRRESQHSYLSERLCCIPILSDVAYDGTDDNYLLRYMSTLRELYECITSCNEAPVRVVKNERFIRPVYQLTHIGRKVQLACKIFARQDEGGWKWWKTFHRRHFHPIVEATLVPVMRWWELISHWWDSDSIVLQYEDDDKAVEAICQLVKDVRATYRSQEFQNAIHEYERKAQSNFRSSCKLVTDLFRQRTRLLVLRIDLYFRPDAKDWGYSGEANRSLRLYLRDLREGRIVPGYLKFIIKEEDAIRRGKHYHLLVLLDGHAHQHAYHLTKLMGIAWEKRVGPAKGSYFNCYARKDRYRFNGLGLVHMSDKEKLIGLRIMLWYMTKRDTILVVDGPRHKSFWSSLKAKSGVKRGAPRKDGDGMELVREMLGGKRSLYRRE